MVYPYVVLITTSDKLLGWQMGRALIFFQRRRFQSAGASRRGGNATPRSLPLRRAGPFSRLRRLSSLIRTRCKADQIFLVCRHFLVVRPIYTHASYKYSIPISYIGIINNYVGTSTSTTRDESRPTGSEKLPTCVSVAYYIPKFEK